MTPNGKYQAKCRECGKLVVEFPILDIPIIGQPDEKAKKVMSAMATHIGTKHPEKLAAGMALVQDFQAFLILSQFETGDPSITARFETIRAGMQALTRKYTLSDGQIQTLLVELESANQFNVATVAQAMRKLRDVLTEQGEYAPKVPGIQTPQSNLIV